MYKLISKNKRDSIILFLIMVILLGVIGALLGYYISDDPIIGIIIAVIFSVISGIFSYYSGDSIILTFSKAKRIEKKDAPQLWNVVEELCIASGLPMPKIYIIEDSSPNAFATGRNPEHASVAITRGLLEKLNREELQGVMGHELSHIQNYDILFGTMIAVMVGTIVIISDFLIRWVFWTGGGRRRGESSSSSNNGLFVIIGILLAILVTLLAQVIKFAVSRKREYLADASSAKMTRNPIGLANALRKIAEDPETLRTANKGIQHLYIVNPLKKNKVKSNIFDTHPPIELRIKRLEELANGKY